MVQRIDESSAQLAEALIGEQARIIVTTLQKFPYILDKIEQVPERNYAVIVDEAHSSQTGQAAAELRRALGSAEPEVEANSEDEPTDAETLLAEAVTARGPQPNLSFFAFTATPKGRTLEMFGEVRDGKHEPFHQYPMRQAIEEAFIMDVLAGYLTYNQYFHLEKSILDDPAYDTGKARSALARFVTLHPDNLAQKAEIIVEHFRSKISRQVGGNAKAMVVCSSRPHAVRMWEALRNHANNLGYDLGVLVAFSGEVDGLTETKANGFGESQTAQRFDTDEWQIMVVAEKFQTGFDQPKLAAMYVDKTLSGLASVQTLSRLNRIHPAKTGTFVVDFVNEADEIQEAFAVYHGKTVAPPTDPNLLFDTRHELDRFDVLDQGEMERASILLVSEGTHAQVDAAMQPAVDRFNALTEEDQDAFRDALGRFVRVYSFLSLVVPFRNAELERDYRFCRALAALIRDRDAAQSINLGAEVELTHLRHDLTFEGSIELPSGEAEVTTIYSGTGPLADPKAEHLSKIIARINERFGTDWTEDDRLVFQAAAADLISDIEIQNQATNNDEATFRDHVFPRAVPRRTAVTPRPQRQTGVQLSGQQRIASRSHRRVRPRCAEARDRCSPTYLPHRRPDRTRPRIAPPGIQIHAALGHQSTAQRRRYRGRRHQDHRRIRQLQIRWHPADRRGRRRLGPRSGRRLCHVHQTRRAGRPRLMGPTLGEPHPLPSW